VIAAAAPRYSASPATLNPAPTCPPSGSEWCSRRSRASVARRTPPAPRRRPALHQPRGHRRRPRGQPHADRPAGV